ncbi:MAG: GAF domain-containing protein [Firmicutes bacterium]|jgi:GAF domain-containing protein|nr:GAF domain-containing protein [Bacillota bacterium]
MSKQTFYERLQEQLEELISAETDWLANLANAAALLYHELTDVNWVGFYLLQGKELVLGPFQGRPACVRIPLGKGVCGNAAQKRSTIVVPDVHEFPGHIACDPASRSELVVPWISGDTLIGVLDLDSPMLARFDSEDAKGLERMIPVLNRYAIPRR